MSKPWESPGFSRGGAVNDYIGNPENWQQLGERYEADEAARAEAIKKYVADTVNGELN